MKRPKPSTLEMDITDTILELRLPNMPERHRISGAAVVLWNTWKRQPDLETGVQAVVKKYQVTDTQARADAAKLYAYLESVGLLE